MRKTAATTGSADSRCILLTDIYQSSRLSEQYPQPYASTLDMHNAAVENAVREYAGQVYKNTGDGFIAFFDRAADCLACAVQLQREFANLPFLGDDDPFLVRIVAHAGVLRAVGSEYYGSALNRTSRICQVCHPGQVLASAAVATPVEGTLPDGTAVHDLGEHHLQDLAEPEHLYQLDHEGFARHRFPPLPTLRNRPNNLVKQPNAFIGRERELAQLKSMLLNSRHLVTITAPGGYGKSRLAAHLCADLLATFERGVFFVELAPVQDHTGITTALADATGFRFYGSRDPKEQLLDYLREKELLLCFDNFEHVLEGASFVSDILKKAPKVKIAITSREPLRIGGEQVYSLEPLPVGGSAPTGKSHADVVLLFADRASLVNAAFKLDEQNLGGIDAICSRLDGIPLAIELAAAWMDSLTLDELRDELDQQLELTARLSDTPKRHRSLRASLEWSWSLLGDEQQRTLMQLSPFRGGCFVEAASAVLGVHRRTLRQTLSKLADKNWVFTREVNGHTRFFLRDAATSKYSFEKLKETVVEGAGSFYERCITAHARYFSGFMEREGVKLYTHHQSQSIQSIDAERQNINATWDSLLNRLKLTDGDEELIGLLMPIARWLWEFLDMTSAHQELVSRYQVLKDAAEQPADQRLLFWALQGCSQGQRRLGSYNAARNNAKAASAAAELLGDRYAMATSLNSMGVAEYAQGNYDAARLAYEESLAVRREIGDNHGVSLSLNNLGALKYIHGDPEAARELYNESLGIKRELGDRIGVAVTLHNLGLFEHQRGNHDVARGLYNESLAIKRELGDRNGTASTLNALGILERNLGHYDKARSAYGESLAIFRDIGNRNGIAMCLNNLGPVERNQGNLEAARGLYEESLAIFREIGDRSGVSFSLNALGTVECCQGNYKPARALFSESLANDREIGSKRGIALSLHNLGAVAYFEANNREAGEFFAESLAIRREIGHPAEISESTAAIGCLLAARAQRQAGAVCLYGARHHAAQLGLAFDTVEAELLEQGLATIEHPETGLPPDECARLKAQAESMSLDELAEFSLDALENLELK